MTFRLVSFHAHPDDEALLTAGTLARAVAEGHRVTLVVATSGEAGLADTGPGRALATTRIAELERSAAALGVHRVVRLDYPDSGYTPAPTTREPNPGQVARLDGEIGHPGPAGFASVDVEQAARRLAEILLDERADVLTGYDRNGGYGHPDHVQVHRVARRAAELAGTPVLLEATVDRTLLVRVLRLLRRARLAPSGFEPERMRNAYAGRDEITHRVNVRSHLDAKRASMAAHASQAGGGEDTRTLAFCLKLPRPLYRLAFGTEWFCAVGRSGPGTSDDIFDAFR